MVIGMHVRQNVGPCCSCSQAEPPPEPSLHRLPSELKDCKGSTKEMAVKWPAADNSTFEGGLATFSLLPPGPSFRLEGGESKMADYESDDELINEEADEEEQEEQEEDTASDPMDDETIASPAKRALAAAEKLRLK